MTPFILALMACKQDEPEAGGPGTQLPTEVPGPQPGPIPPPEADPSTCDAGQQAWVQRIFPLVLGRKPHGAGEIGMWASFAETRGRREVIRAMTTSPEFRRHWKALISDMLYVFRSGFGEDSSCFQIPRTQQHDGSIAQWIRTEQPDLGQYPQVFNMADVVIDGLVADDISVIFQANLFARLNYSPFGSFDLLAIENERRVYHGDLLLEVYLDRDLDCMGCHNSEYSVTDDADPALDRAWGRGALFEKALFGESWGPSDPAEFYAINRYFGVVQDPYYGYGYGYGDDGVYDTRPWNMDGSCGSFDRTPPETDYLGQETSYFGQAYGAEGSLWQIERLFDSGVDAMSGEAFTFAEDGTVEPAQAFAYLTGQHFVDQVWKLTHGGRLLLPYGMARNQDQQERLQRLTDAFVTGGWSLTELLVDITADPYFNAGLPETCGAPAYGMKPVFDPYSVVNEGALAGNGPGDLVHRHTGRVLLSSFYDALGFGEPPEYFGYGSGYYYGGDDSEESIQRSLGVFHSDASPGFNGVDFQGALEWENQFHGCQDPTGGSSTGFLGRLFDEGYERDQTVEAVALSLKDRLVNYGQFEDDTERELVSSLLGYPLDTKVRDVDSADFSRNLSLLCGVLTLTPEFMLTAEPRDAGPVPALSFDLEDDCEHLSIMASNVGVPVDCEGGSAVFPD